MAPTAFVSTVAALRVAPSAGSAFSGRPVTYNAAPARATVTMIDSGKDSSKDGKARLPIFPQGFTLTSEKLNGRLAMMGFVLAMLTEAINPSHPGIAAQVGSIFEIINMM